MPSKPPGCRSRRSRRRTSRSCKKSFAPMARRDPGDCEPVRPVADGPRRGACAVRRVEDLGLARTLALTARLTARNGLAMRNRRRRLTVSKTVSRRIGGSRVRIPPPPLIEPDSARPSDRTRFADPRRRSDRRTDPDGRRPGPPPFVPSLSHGAPASHPFTPISCIRARHPVFRFPAGQVWGTGEARGRGYSHRCRRGRDPGDT